MGEGGGKATCVIHLRDGRRYVVQQEPTPWIVFPVPRARGGIEARVMRDMLDLIEESSVLSALSGEAGLATLARSLERPIFDREHYRLMDYREIAGVDVATYVPSEPPTYEIHAAPPTRWQRARSAWRRLRFMLERAAGRWPD